MAQNDTATNGESADGMVLTDAGIDLGPDPLVPLWEMRDDFHGHLEVIAETDDRIVFADHGGNEYVEHADDLGVDIDHISERMYAEASDLTEYDWSAADPLVFVKSDR